MGRWRNRRGSSALEFAIVGLPTAMVLLAFFELLLMAANSMLFVSATEEVSRVLYTGQFQKSSNNTEKDLQELFCEQAVLIDCDEDLLIDLRNFGSWDDVTLPTLINEDGTYTVDSEPSDTEEVNICGNRIVVMRVLYRWNLTTPGMAYFLRGSRQGNMFLFQARIFIVEPWDFTLSC